jgi:copper chaperone NosL
MREKGDSSMMKIIVSGLLIGLMCSFAYGGDMKPAAPKPGDKCAVCGMFVAKYKNWVAEIRFKDGSSAFFDGPKDMFRYYLDVGRYDAHRRQADVAAVFVTEYYSTLMMDANAVVFVTGSDVNGPMGAELVPVETAGKAKEFMKDHGGRKIVKFGEVGLKDLR